MKKFIRLKKISKKFSRKLRRLRRGPRQKRFEEVIQLSRKLAKKLSFKAKREKHNPRYRTSKYSYNVRPAHIDQKFHFLSAYRLLKFNVSRQLSQPYRRRNPVLRTRW